MKLGRRFRPSDSTKEVKWLKKIFSRFIDFLKQIAKKIYTWFILRQLKNRLNHLEKSRLKCFQDMGEKIYELKKDSSFELIDLAAVNACMEQVRQIDDKIKSVRMAIKDVKLGKIEGFRSWWSRRGSNP